MKYEIPRLIIFSAEYDKGQLTCDGWIVSGRIGLFLGSFCRRGLWGGGKSEPRLQQISGKDPLAAKPIFLILDFYIHCSENLSLTVVFITAKNISNIFG